MTDDLRFDPQAPGRAGEPLEAAEPGASPGDSRAARAPGYGPGYGLELEQPGGDVHLMDYVRVLYKRRGTAITAFLAVFLTVAIYTFTQTPVYEGRTQLLIESENPNVVSFKEVLQQDKSTTDFYQTQYKLLQSRATARRTIDELRLWQRPELGGGAAGAPAQGIGDRMSSAVQWVVSPVAGLFGGGSPATEATEKGKPQATESAKQSKVIDAFLKHLTISPIRNSRLVDVQFESTDPSLAAAAANALAGAYVQQNLDLQFKSSRDASDMLGQRLDEQRKKVEASQLALQQYREHGDDSLALDEGQNIVVQQLTERSAAVTRAQIERIQKEEQYKRLVAIENNRAALDTFPAVSSNTLIQQLKMQLGEQQRELERKGMQLDEQHPEMQRLKSTMQSTQARLDGEIQKVKETVRNEYLAAQQQERSLDNVLQQQKSAALALKRRGIDYAVLQKDFESNQQIYDALLQRAKETGVSAELKTTNIRIVDVAEVPRQPVRPKRSLNLLLGILGGAMLGAGLAFFFEHADNRIKSPDEIKAHLGLPFMGLIPAVKAKGDDGAALTINNGVPANFAEAFRSIRTNLLFSSPDEGCRSLVVTSTAPGEGKTLVASNVAMALAQAGQRVLLVDCDMRRPRVHEMFDGRQEPGLSNVITANAAASEAVARSAVPGLWVLPAGANPPNPAELVGSKRFKELLTKASEQFDWVVLDTPPVMAVTDAALVAHRATGVLFVVACESTNRHAAVTALEQLEAAKAKVLGAVLNRVNVERNAYYYSHYYHRDYANYYQKDAAAN